MTPLPNRQSIRNRGWDYTTPGWYFVTLCVQDMRPVFGTVVNGKMVLNETGQMAREMWLAVEKYHPEYHLDEFVVMPNHVHGLVQLEGRPDGQEGRPDDLPLTGGCDGLPLRDGTAGLPDFVRRFKSTADVAWRKMAGAGRCASPGPDTMRNGKLWHRNYWDVIVRDEQALANIRQYIRFNPQNYDRVMNAGQPRMLGNAGMLALRKVGYLASRGAEGRAGATTCPCEPDAAIISGFLSPMERAVFTKGLEHKTPLIWVKPWGLEDGVLAAPVRRAIDESRLLVVSPFADSIEAPSVRRAAWCNQYVLAHCDRLIVGHLTPGGMLSCILSEADPDLEITYL
jgi:REP element-mobilizing transposase RayT